ncbi:MAG: ABC transporter substrate-binding protein [Pseudomonadota bacterium]|nr:ABC transporter substrate-binding protein [Pseudomonadota bacterium]
MRRFLGIAGLACALVAGAAAHADVGVDVVYLRVAEDLPPVLSNLDPRPDDLGVAGAMLGLEDNRTTGRFLGQTHELTVIEVALGEDPTPAAREALGAADLVLVDAPAEALEAIADMEDARDALLFNVAAPDVYLRGDGCRANLLHTIPSRAMLADALMQVLLAKKWNDLALVSGTRAGDEAWAAALRDSASKFRLSIRGEKTWGVEADMRRNASAEVPLFTQDLKDHDVLLIADEAGDFGRYIAYNTMEPRPVAGSEGMVPVAWSRVVEQWGAAQLQSRFVDLAGRDMESRDYAAWAAMRTIGEAVTRANAADAARLRAYILSDDFELAGFKGRPMSYRAFNGQLRQPIALVTERAVVADAPMDGFLHSENELDTLGLDRPESACTAFED